MPMCRRRHRHRSHNKFECKVQSPNSAMRWIPTYRKVYYTDIGDLLWLAHTDSNTNEHMLSLYDDCCLALTSKRSFHIFVAFFFFFIFYFSFIIIYFFGDLKIDSVVCVACAAALRFFSIWLVCLRTRHLAKWVNVSCRQSQSIFCLVFSIELIVFG